MKALTVLELDNVVALLQPLVGTRLQEVQTAAQDVVLGFYTPKGLLWLWIDLNAVRPSVLPWSEMPMRVKSRPSPLQLFLRAHFANRVLRDVRRDMDEGRVARLLFGGAGEDGRAELELRLFPHGRNLIARAAGKQVAWQKTKSLAPGTPEQVLEPAHAPVRTLDQLREQWRAARNVKARGSGHAEVMERLQQELARKKKALAKVSEELQRKRELPWKAVGDWLKANQSLLVPREWEPFIDRRRKLSWNIENCFGRARELEGKAFGTERRLEILQADIARLRAALEQPASALVLEPERAPPRVLKEIEAQGRTLRLSGDLVAVSGKNAADNLKLLRKARAWDYWIHLRDHPSSHAILFRNKNATVGDSVLQQVFAWFVRNQFGHKLDRHAGDRFAFLVAECRHVRPIKGDKLGRVTYQNERVLIYKVPG